MLRIARIVYRPFFKYVMHYIVIKKFALEFFWSSRNNAGQPFDELATRIRDGAVGGGGLFPTASVVRL